MNAPATFLRPAPQLYWPGETNRCPCCGGRAWHVGRVTAECAACDHALPLAHAPEGGEAVWEGPATAEQGEQ
ncbi:hypothetical protein [Erythrobacter colymbi]|uniref:hypothetical protein n=1 Tax=Erythrobacter colymbi TaxID=1161202 RepID=UPI000A37D5CC|nr:hypothetical protein [Erythrobacter colymbi]